MSDAQPDKPAEPLERSVPPDELDESGQFSDLDSEDSGGYRDQIDRSRVFDEGLKILAGWCVRLLVVAVAGYAIWFLLKQFWAGVLPIVLALLLCTVLAPPTAWLRRHRWPSSLAALTVMLGTLSAVVCLFMVIAPDVARQSTTLYYQAFDGIQRLRLWLQGPPLNLDSEDLDDAVNQAASWLQDQAGAIAGGIFSGFSAATSVIVTLAIVIVLVFFFLKDGHRFLPWLRRATGRRVGRHGTELLTRAWNTLGGFIRAQAAVSFVDAVLIGIGLTLIGVPMALALAVITFIAGFIPYIGAITAGALSVLIALVSLGFTEAILALALILAVQQIEGNILSPILQSKAMDLHPVIVLISVTVGGGLFGIIGAFLAVPVAAMIAVALRYVQDMAMLRSGERKTSDIKFATNAGIWTGRYTEEAGKRMRAKREDPPVVVPDQRLAPVTVTGEDTTTLLTRLNEATSTLTRLFGREQHK
ncbi:AI-2 transport protein TqsA [Corynebacterium occultum]|uniref:AI-2 transport protein TqsA n=1 Tax=Corynebacterium occultum TaxID=2675219 RepID=A0A6B8W075_9CORY|nr:AI-2E family transporter [Corynebacterium occultum]QGU06894.1 AI-2 transport protein TqsA [Corynebacterium occultum]